MPGLPFQFVSIERREELALLTIDDPPANTLTYDLVVQLEEAFFELSLDPGVRAVVLTGVGERFFSGGVNIGMLRTSSPHFNSNFLLYAAEVFELIDQAPLLVVAAINGHVTGGGLELGLIADRRVAVEGTYNFGFPEVRLGVIPGLGGTQRLSRLIGARQALELITHGDFIPVRRAQELGIVDAVLPKEHFLQGAIDFTRRELRNAQRVTSTRPAIPWQRPQDSLVRYERSGRTGVITLSRECPESSALQVVWALNQAILKARMDEGTEAILITHESARLQLGAEGSMDEHVWRYARFVFDRLESFPRLCVVAFSSGLSTLASELALACDYRLVPARKNASDTLLAIPAASTRYTRYVARQNGLAAHDGSVTYAQAVEQGLVKTFDAAEWPEAPLKWMSRFVPPRGASKSIGYAKLAIVKGASLPHSAGMLLERHLQEQLFRGLDGPEGMRAYLEKRAAVFKGE